MRSYGAAGEADAHLSRPQLFGGSGGFPREELPTDGRKVASFFARSQRQRLNVVPICQCLLLPWGLFCIVYATMSFRWHYTQPALCALVVGIAMLTIVACGGVACVPLLRRLTAAGDEPRQPSWLLFLALSSAVAWTFGVVFGNANFRSNMQPYYDYANLNDYTRVDPSRMRGQQLMDAGRVNFTASTVLDLSKAMGFRDLDTYCVAPITVRRNDTVLQLQSYDFWAVGMNCCEGDKVADNFRCGEYSNPFAHQGLRLLRDDQRPYFRLAVQQAEASHNIKATHPLFFYWGSDALEEMQAFRDEGYKYCLIGMLGFFAFQVLCVGLATFGFSKLGRS